MLDFREISGLDPDPVKCELLAPGLYPDDVPLRELRTLLPGRIPVTASSLGLLGSSVLSEALNASPDTLTDRTLPFG